MVISLPLRNTMPNIVKYACHTFIIGYVDWITLVGLVSWLVQQYFSYIVAVSFIGGGNQRKVPTCRK
jgi:hypothetical protein